MSCGPTVINSMTFHIGGPGTLSVRVYYHTAISSCLSDHAESGNLTGVPYQVSGGVTPSQNNSLIVFGGAVDTSAGPWTTSAGFTIQTQLAPVTFTGGFLADLIQTTLGNVSPTISFTDPNSASAALAVFKQ